MNWIDRIGIRPLAFPSSPRNIRHFAFTTAAVLGVIGVWLFVRRSYFPLWIVYVDGALMILAANWPKVLIPFYQVWMNLGHLLGWINTRIILAVMFFILITSVGLFRRLLKKGTMSSSLQKDPDCDTYAVPMKPRDREHFKWQF